MQLVDSDEGCECVGEKEGRACKERGGRKLTCACDARWDGVLRNSLAKNSTFNHQALWKSSSVATYRLRSDQRAKLIVCKRIRSHLPHKTSVSPRLLRHDGGGRWRRDGEGKGYGGGWGATWWYGWWVVVRNGWEVGKEGGREVGVWGAESMALVMSSKLAEGASGQWTHLQILILVDPSRARAARDGLQMACEHEKVAVGGEMEQRSPLKGELLMLCW